MYKYVCVVGDSPYIDDIYMYVVLLGLAYSATIVHRQI